MAELGTGGRATFAPADRQRWPDATKALALALIFTNHCVELVFGSGRIGNPLPEWGTFGRRVDELRPFPPSEQWRVAATVVRWVGWLGDQAVGPFIVVTGFGLAWQALKRDEPARQFYRRRLRQIYPMWWATLTVFLAVAAVSGSDALSIRSGAFWASAVGFRATPGTIYYGVGAWWYVTLAVQLMLVFPHLFRVLRRLGPTRSILLVACPALAVRLVGLLVLSTYLDVWSRGAVFVSRLSEFVLGAALALALNARNDRAGALDRTLRSRPALLAYALAYAVATILALTLAGMALAPTLFAIALTGVVYARTGGATRPARGRGAVEWVGRHSLSLYLVHHPIVSKLVKADHMGPMLVAQVAASVVATVATAIILETAVGHTVRLVSGLLSADRQAARVSQRMG